MTFFKSDDSQIEMNTTIHCRVLRLAAGGILDKWTQVYLPLNNKCGKNINVQEAKPLTLKNTQGIFLGLFVTIILSLVVFILELVFMCCGKIKRSHPTSFTYINQDLVSRALSNRNGQKNRKIGIRNARK